MNSLYGNIIMHPPRSNFEIYETYPNAAKMFQSIQNSDTPLYGYALIDYDYPNVDYDETAQQQGGLYQFNNLVDQQKWGSDILIINYDQTVWQKTINHNGELTYRAIARLNSILPDFSAPASYFQKADSLLTFQRLNAVPLVQRNVPDTYEDFGTASTSEAVILFDKKAVNTFNTRYPSPRNAIPMELNPEHPSLSMDNSKKFEEKINNQIDLSTGNQTDIDYYTEMLDWYLNTFLFSLSTLTITELPNSLKYYNSDTLEYPTK